MSSKETIHIGENSPEEVAYKLFEKIAAVEGKVFYKNPQNSGLSSADREWILKAYSEALVAVRSPGLLAE